MLDGKDLARRLADAMENARPKKVTRAALAEVCKVTPQAVYDWLRTGKVARKHFPKIARATGKPINYFFDEGNTARDAARGDYGVENALLDAYSNLPDGLKQYLVRKAGELQAYAASLPSFISEALRAPEDEDEYRVWERDLEADMARIRFAARAKRDPGHPGDADRAPARRRDRGSSRG